MNEPDLILCANRRLADRIEAEAVASAARPIERPPAYTFEQWCLWRWQEERDRAALADELLPLPLEDEEARLALWERSLVEAAAEQRDPKIEERVALALPRLAEAAERAFRLAALHGIGPDDIAQATPESDAQGLFVRGLGKYRAMLGERGLLDPAELPERLRARIAEGRALVPATVELRGFRDRPPALERLCEALARRGTTIDRKPIEEREPEGVAVEAFATPREELRAAARWALAIAQERPEGRFAIVLADLHVRRREALAVLDQELCPWRRPGETRPYGISLGVPLAECFPVREALAALEWQLAAEGLPPPEARSALLGLAGLDPARARLAGTEWKERERLPPRLRPEHFALSEAREALGEPNHRRPPADWAGRFRKALQSLGFPRTLDSAAFQALERLEECLRRLAALGSALGEIGASEALCRLRRMLARRLFQPRQAPQRIELLGPLEAMGQTFDGVWIAGLNAERFPPRREPDPLLPFALQRKHQLPGTDPQVDAEHDRRWLRALLGLAPEIRLSHALAEEDRPLTPSPFPWRSRQSTAPAPSLPTPWQGWNGKSAEVEDRRRAPLADGTRLHGGARRIADHLDCPFRGFALHELGAGRPSDPGPVPDARELGTLIHRLLAALARRDPQFFRPSDAVDRSGHAPEAGKAAGAGAGHDTAAAFDLSPQQKAILDEEIERLLTPRQDATPQGSARALPEAELPTVLPEPPATPQGWARALPKPARDALPAVLEQIVARLLQAERRRAPFEILMVEGKPLNGASPIAQSLELAGLELELRCDRVDRLEDGRLAVIDYKSGREAKLPGSEGEIRDPQLALYAQLDEKIAAVLYARLHPGAGDAVYTGHADASARLGITLRNAGENFPALRERWRERLETAAKEIRDGSFPARPRKGVCRRCELAALCRIAAGSGAATAEDDEDKEE